MQKTIINDGSNIAIFSHDAGGAQVLSSFLLNNCPRFSGIIKGPARNIFLQRNLMLVDDDLQICIKNADCIITSTSWQSEIEREAISFAKTTGKRSISILDHWVNYLERFSSNGTINYPDEIWVCDDAALSIATEIFKNTPVFKITNYDLQNFKKKFRAMSENITAEKNSFLFLNDNSLAAGKLLKTKLETIFTDEHAFKNLLYAIERKGLRDFRVTIRLHPSESLNANHWAHAYLNKYTTISQSADYVYELLTHEFICGSDSNGMFYAAECGKTVLSCANFDSIVATIPQKKLISLRTWSLT